MTKNSFSQWGECQAGDTEGRIFVLEAGQASKGLSMEGEAHMRCPLIIVNSFHGASACFLTGPAPHIFPTKRDYEDLVGHLFIPHFPYNILVPRDGLALFHNEIQNHFYVFNSYAGALL